jgi:hypothetical protein
MAIASRTDLQLDVALRLAATELAENRLPLAGGEAAAAFRLALGDLFGALAAELALARKMDLCARNVLAPGAREDAIFPDARSHAKGVVPLLAPHAPASAVWQQLAGRYAALLELRPVVTGSGDRIAFAEAIGGDRKETGSYYTPDALVQCLLDSALEPVLARAAAQTDPEEALLALRICDPACGAGQFLVGAGRRLAVRLAQVRERSAVPSQAALANAMREVVALCLYGLDCDPIAAELCRVSLRLEAAPDFESGPGGGPDDHVRVGNGILGAAPGAEFITWNAADAWCAAIVAPGDEPAAVARRFGFFHWPLALPEIFERGGFDVVLGNPPWERLKIQDKEWFGARRPDVAAACHAADRRARIAALAREAPDLWREFQDACAAAEGESRFVRQSGRYPLCGRGDVNTYAAFAETFLALVGPNGRAGFIVPSGIATDHTARAFFSHLLASRRLHALYDFENRKKLFPAVDSRVKFALLTVGGKQSEAEQADFVFFAHTPGDLRDPRRRVALSAADLALINPNTGNCPIFRTSREAELVRAIHTRVPVFIREGAQAGNPWQAEFCRMFDMANDSGEFRATPGPDTVPLYEAKLLHQFDHRWATFEDGTVRLASADEKADPAFSVRPRYWVERGQVESRIGSGTEWLWAFRDIARSTDERTAMAAILPPHAVSHHAPLLRLAGIPADRAALLLANFNALALDFVARTKVGGTHLTFFIVKQLPLLAPDVYDPQLAAEILARVLELTYTSRELAPFAKECGYQGPPFRWDAERRFALRCELDAIYFRLYKLGCAEAAEVLDTFEVLRRKEIAAFGRFRTKDRVLEALSRSG